MSVSLFSAGELGNVARALAPGADDYGRHCFMAYCALLAEVSRCNAAAYRGTYEKDDEPPAGGWATHHVASEIMREAPDVTRWDRLRATRTARLLQYNCVSNDGKNWLDERGLNALCDVLSGLVGLLGERDMAAERMRAVR